MTSLLHRVLNWFQRVTTFTLVIGKPDPTYREWETFAFDELIRSLDVEWGDRS